MIGRASCHLGHNTVKPEVPQIERIDECIDDSDRIVLIDPVVQALGKQGGLAAIHAFDKAPHRIPQTSASNPITGRVFTQPGSKRDLVALS